MAIYQPYKLPSNLRKHVQEIATNIPTFLYGRIAAMVPGVGKTLHHSPRSTKNGTSPHGVDLELIQVNVG